MEKEQRQRLQQLTAAQEDQRSISDFKEIFGQAEAKLLVSISYSTDIFINLGCFFNLVYIQSNLQPSAKQLDCLSMLESFSKPAAKNASSYTKFDKVLL